MIDLSIIIVNFNTEKLLIECIKSIINFSLEISYEVIVVDNNSNDGTLESIQNFLRSRISLRETNFKLIKNKENVGFSKANNIGIKEARGRYILFLNSDTVVYKKTLETMVEFMDENKEAGCATCKVVLPNGKLDDASHRGFPTPLNSLYYFSGLSKMFPKSRNFAGYNLGHINIDTIHEIDACAGAFMIVRRQAGEEINWWDEDYFWYGEDIDFCYRLKRKGYKIYFVSTVSILHYKGASGGIKDISKHLTTADEKTKKQAQKARFEAMRIFYNKHYKSTYPWFVNWLIYRGIGMKKWISSR